MLRGEGESFERERDIKSEERRKKKEERSGDKNQG